MKTEISLDFPNIPPSWSSYAELELIQCVDRALRIRSEIEQTALANAAHAVWRCRFDEFGNLARGESDIAIRAVTAVPVDGEVIVSGGRGFLGLGQARK
jgi:hypothetical protein